MGGWGFKMGVTRWGFKVGFSSPSINNRFLKLKNCNLSITYAHQHFIQNENKNNLTSRTLEYVLILSGEFQHIY